MPGGSVEPRLLVPLAVGLLLAAGCSLLGSSGALSDSLSDSASVGSRAVAASSRGLSASSESSLPADDDDDAYRGDVRVVTAAAVAAGGPLGIEFSRQLAAVARHHGVSDWEGRDDTFRAVGEGLREAGVAPEALGAWVAGMPGLDPGRRRLVREGYASASP